MEVVTMLVNLASQIKLFEGIAAGGMICLCDALFEF